MALAPTPENFRAEMVRMRIRKRDLAALISMHPSLLYSTLTGHRPLTGWAAHNIGLGLNLLSKRRLFDVDETVPLMTPRRGRPPGRGSEMERIFRDLIPAAPPKRRKPYWLRRRRRAAGG